MFNKALRTTCSGHKNSFAFCFWKHMPKAYFDAKGVDINVVTTHKPDTTFHEYFVNSCKNKHKCETHCFTFLYYICKCKQGELRNNVLSL